MSWLDGFTHRVRTLLNPGAYDREMDDEIAHHRELGAANGEASRFGNRTYHKEEARRMTWLGSLDVLRQDALYAWRSLRRTPGFTATVVVTLALGIGLNAATFGVLDRLYLSPPAGVAEPSQVRRVWLDRGGSYVGEPMSYLMFQGLAAASGDSSRMAVVTGSSGWRVGGTRKGPSVDVLWTSANYFSLLGVKPALGRFYLPDENREGGPKVIVVSYRFWEQNLNGDSSRVGKPLVMDTTSFLVLGVTPPGFHGIDMRPSDVWAPMHTRPNGRTYTTSPRRHSFRVFTRIDPSTPEKALEQRTTAAIKDVQRRFMPADTMYAVRLGPVIASRGPGTGEKQEVMISSRLVGVAAIVLLIAVANVVNLLLSRAVSRRREIAVRLALGISRARLVRLLTTETLLLACVAGLAALLSAWWGAGALRALLVPDIAWDGAAVSGKVVALTITVTLACGIVAGVIPAMQSSNPELTGALKEGGRGSSRPSRLSASLVVAQAALSVVLLTGSAMFVRSLKNVEGLDLGFDQSSLLFGYVAFEPGQYPTDQEIGARMASFQERLASRPGIEGVARSGNTPIGGISFATFYWGSDSSQGLAGQLPTFAAVSPEYFATTGISILSGRTFNAGDAGRYDIVVNDQMARLLWPGDLALGKCIHMERRDSPCYTVVGVVEGSTRSNVIENPSPQYFLPLGIEFTKLWGGSTLIVRVRPNAERAARLEMMRALQEAFPSSYPVITRMTDTLEKQYRPWRLGATLFTAFGLLALVVAVVGIYSTVAYSVGRRTHEFGVRVALGARIRDVLSQVLGEGTRVIAIGVALGVVFAAASGRLVASMLFGVEPTDLSAMLLASCVLLLSASAAAAVPAWRAARVDPTVALRSD